MKFTDYITRKTGVGRTSWFFAIVIHLGAGAAIWYGQSMIRNAEPWGWVVAGMGALIAVGFWLGTRNNYRRDKAAEERGSSNKHRNDICETCNPVCWKKDGAPLKELHIWFAAINDISWDQAQMRLGTMPLWQVDEYKKDHARYLDHPKFRKFRP